MKPIQLLLFLLLVLPTGCSVKIVPEQVPAGIINQKENSISLEKEHVVMTLSPAETDMVNYNTEGMVASFNVEIRNNGDDEVVFDNESFILLDADKRQYYQLTPEKLLQMLTKDTYYLLPYPYVGFYYLEDYQQAAFKNSTDSNLPYFFEVRPQDIYTRSLPTEPLIPKATVKGQIFFHADVDRMPAFKILVFKKGTPKKSEPAFTFPFRVVK